MDNRWRLEDNKRVATKSISDWGIEGVRSASRLVGEGVAHSLLEEHVRNNVQGSFPGISVTGAESTEELQGEITDYQEDKTTRAMLKDKRLREEAKNAMYEELDLVSPTSSGFIISESDPVYGNRTIRIRRDDKEIYRVGDYMEIYLPGEF